MGDSSSNVIAQREREKMYTKPGWTPVTTELNDREKRIIILAGGDRELTHEDWCEDNTCNHRERP